MQLLLKSILSSIAVATLCLSFVAAQQPSPVVTIQGQKMMERTVCFQLAPLQSQADIAIPADAVQVYVKINWTGGSSILQVSMQANELRRAKARWEGASPLEKAIKMDPQSSTQWHLKIYNPSDAFPAYGCCILYYSVDQKIKNNMVFDGSNLQIDTGKMTYATLLNIDKSSWGDGTIKMMPDGEVGIVYANGNNIKYLENKHLVLYKGDSIYNINNRDMSPLFNQIPYATPPPMPSSFDDSSDQAWLNLFSKWINYSNDKLYELSQGLIEKSELKIDKDLKFSDLKKQVEEKKGTIGLHDFLINTLLIAIAHESESSSKNK